MIRLALLATSAALIAGSAMAQPAEPDTTQATLPAAQTGTASDVAATERMTPDGRPIMLRSSPTPVGDAYRLKAGDPTVVANAPVPDTVENRRAYGGPQSNGGRRTAPRGN